MKIGRALEMKLTRSTEMTNEQKKQIIVLYKRGSSMAEVADKLGMSIGTVKSFWRRNFASSQLGEVKEESVEASEGPKVVSEWKTNKCKRCGKPVSTLPHHKAKQFCSDECRLAWWHENRHLAKGTSERTCPVCGITFTGDVSRKYCCHSCYIKARYGRKGLPEEENDYESGTV
jgi:transposase-like protein